MIVLKASEIYWKFEQLVFDPRRISKNAADAIWAKENFSQ